MYVHTHRDPLCTCVHNGERLLARIFHSKNRFVTVLVSATQHECKRPFLEQLLRGNCKLQKVSIVYMLYFCNRIVSKTRNQHLHPKCWSLPAPGHILSGFSHPSVLLMQLSQISKLTVNLHKLTWVLPSSLCDHIKELTPLRSEVKATRWRYHYIDSSLKASSVVQSGNGLLCVLFKWCTCFIFWF